MPTAEELPRSLKALVRRNAVPLSHHRFGPEVDALARTLQRVLGLPPSPPLFTLSPLRTRRLLRGSFIYSHSRDEFRGSHFGFLAWLCSVPASWLWEGLLLCWEKTRSMHKRKTCPIH